MCDVPRVLVRVISGSVPKTQLEVKWNGVLVPREAFFFVL